MIKEEVLDEVIPFPILKINLIPTSIVVLMLITLNMLVANINYVKTYYKIGIINNNIIELILEEEELTVINNDVIINNVKVKYEILNKEKIDNKYLIRLVTNTHYNDGIIHLNFIVGKSNLLKDFIKNIEKGRNEWLN